MSIFEDTDEQSDLIAAKLIRAIEQDETIVSSDSLSSQAVKDNLPAICRTITKAIIHNNPQLLATSAQNQGSKHGETRSAQDFAPEEITREFFLLKEIVLAELKPQLLKNSPKEIIEQVALIDLVINKVTENSFSTYKELRKQQLNALHRQIFFTNQEISRLIADHQDSLEYLVHEIKNPLTSIIGYSDLYLRQQRSADVSGANLQHIQQVLKQGRNVLRLINDTWEISDYEQGNLKLRIQQIDICVLLEDIILGLKPNIDAKQLNLITSCIPEKLLIESDALRLQQIITNLLTNAIRYTVTGTIELTCRRTEYNSLEIKVKDTGIGISEQDCKRIFEPYFRSRLSQTKVPEGIGLGLAIVAQLVSALGGKIKLDSEVNRGSTFIVEIPLTSPK